MQGRIEPALKWFEKRGWNTFSFQERAWASYLDGKSGLIHSATGTGKTLAAWMGPLLEALETPEDTSKGIRVLWITPLRALAADTLTSLMLPAEELGLDWTLELRTGDSSAASRARHREQLPTALVTTPESLTLFLSRPNAETLFSNLRLIVCDEWHELMSSKRGVQTELAIARLRRFRPQVRTWGISATLGNLEESLSVLVGQANPENAVIIEGSVEKRVVIDSLLPPNISRFPWSGHFGAQMLGPVIQAIEEGGACLLFTNTRSHAELWYQDILDAKPEWKDEIGLHHGSLSREVRDEVEDGLKSGRLRAVVCTSSLDLGVDFSPVDRVLQLGSPKGVARLMQRAGRSGHRPGAPSRVTCVPTHAFELVDMAAARNAAQQGRIESRTALSKPLDVLAQHLLTIAAGDGFESDPMLAEIRSTFAYRDLSDQEWTWVLDFVTTGGSSLRAYPEYHRVVLNEGRYGIRDEATARRHRMSIGTIVSDASMNVQFVSGGRIGTIEESFIARLSPGDKFLFGGRALQFVRVKELTAWVKKASSVSGAVPRWMGGRLPLSGELANAIREELHKAKEGILDSPEMMALAPILRIQAKWSEIPASDEFLIERVEDREGHHLFFYPFEGRLVHEGLAALFAYRIAKVRPISFSMAMNDYGFELLSPEPAPLEEALASGLLSSHNLSEEIILSLNSVEMAKRQFREVARIAGLIFQGFPGSQKSTRQIQSSSGLFYDVFARFDPENMLLHQSQREVLEKQLEQSRMRTALDRLAASRLLITHPVRPTPLSFPILVDRLRQTLSTESIPDRIRKLAAQMEVLADQTGEV